MAKKKKEQDKGKKKKKKEILLDGVDISTMDQEKLMTYFIKEVNELYKIKKKRNFEEEERNFFFRKLEHTRGQLAKNEAQAIFTLKDMEDLSGNHNSELLVSRQRINYLRFVLEKELLENKSEQDMFEKQHADLHREHLRDIENQRSELKSRHKEERQAHEQNIKEAIEVSNKRCKAVSENYFDALDDRFQKYTADHKEMDEDAKTETQMLCRFIDQKRLEHIMHLQKNFEKNYSDVKQYFQELTFHNLTLIDDLQSQANTVKGHLTGLYDRFHEVHKAIAVNTEPVRQQTHNLAELKKQADLHTKEKSSLDRINQNIASMDNERRKLTTEVENYEKEWHEIKSSYQKLRSDYFFAAGEAKGIIGCQANNDREKAVLLREKVVQLKSALQEAVANDTDHKAKEHLRELEGIEKMNANNAAEKNSLEATLRKMMKNYDDAVRMMRYVVEKYNLSTPEDLNLMNHQPETAKKMAEIGRLGRARDILR